MLHFCSLRSFHVRYSTYSSFGMAATRYARPIVLAIDTILHEVSTARAMHVLLFWNHSTNDLIELLYDPMVLDKGSQRL